MGLEKQKIKYVELKNNGGQSYVTDNYQKNIQPVSVKSL